MNGYTNTKEKGNEVRKHKYEYGRFQNPQVWEIYFADIPKIKGSHATCGKRPVIVCSNEICNYTSSEINVYPITTRIRDDIPTHVTIYPDVDNGLKEKSQIRLEEPRTLSKDNLLDYMGRVTDFGLMKKIVHGIMIQNSMIQCVMPDIMSYIRPYVIWMGARNGDNHHEKQRIH